MLKAISLQNNQYIIDTDGAVYFQSYDSQIAKIEKTGSVVVFNSKWNYSKTTLRHLYQYLNREIGYIDDQDKKEVIRAALASNNTRAALQKLIDNGTIVYVD